jgi:hypothetical protein
MNTIKIWAAVAWLWLKRGWSFIYNFAPWKALFITWVIEYAILFIVSLVLIVFGKAPVTTGGFFGFLMHMCLFMGIYLGIYDLVYPKKEQP